MFLRITIIHNINTNGDLTMIYIFCIITIVALFAFAAYQFYTYQNSAYRKNTGNLYLSVLLDAGRNAGS